MDLISFLANKKNSGNKQENTEPDGDMAEDVKEKLKQYEGKSEEELMSDLLANVEAAKSEGTFSKEALEEFKSRVATMLSEEQRRRLDEITGKLE